MVKTIRARRWVFTLNNYTEEECDKISAINCRYLIYGYEEGENGTPHLQGYIVFDNAKSFNRLKNMMPRAHIEPAGGTHQENYNYCTKQDKQPYEKGELPEDHKYAIHARKIIERDPINAQKIISSKRMALGMQLEKEMFKEIKINKLSKPEVTYIWGDTGTGKTYFAIQDATFRHGYKNVSLIKFDKNGFAHCNNPNAECLVWMEFRPSCLAATDFLELTDGYGCYLNVKHGSYFIRPKSLYICSILPPSQIYKEEINEQFQRRITRYVNKNDNPYQRTVSETETEEGADPADFLSD